MTDWTALRYAVVDVEGNGHHPPDLVEAAVVPIVGGAVGRPACWLVKPDHPIRFSATRVHGLTNADLAQAPPAAAIGEELRAALAADAVVAHNAHVDVDVLGRTLPGWQCPEVFDTLALARRLLPGRSSYKLGALVDEFGLAEGLPADLSPHRASYDALVAARLFVRLATGEDGQPRSLAVLRNPPSGNHAAGNHAPDNQVPGSQASEGGDGDAATLF